MLINAWVASVPCCSAASGRKCLQASGIERGRSSVQRLMMAKHWPAKQVVCVEILVFLCLSNHVLFLQVKNQRLAALNKRHHVEWCTSMLQRLCETKKPLRVPLSQDTFPRHSPHCFKPLCNRFSRRSLPYSFTHFHAIDRFLSFRLCWP